MEVKYHPGKENVVADALSTKSTGTMARLLMQEKRLLKELNLPQIEVVLPRDQSYVTALQISSPLIKQIKWHQKDDSDLMRTTKGMEEGRNMEFSIKNEVL